MENQGDDELIRESLLGELVGAELEQLEVRLMSEPKLFERSLVIQQELVDAFVEGRLARKEKKKFGRLFLSTPQGREQVRLTRALIARASRKENERARNRRRQWLPTRRFPLSPIWGAAAVLVVLSAGVVIWKVFIDEYGLRRGVANLKAAYQRQRPILSRVSGFDWAPPSGERGGVEPGFDLNARNLAERWLTEAVAEKASPSRRHALGKFYLLKGDLDKAIEQFREALRVDDKNVELLSDLGAALFEKGKASAGGQSIDAFSESLDLLTKSLELKPTLQEALFNRALLLEEMTLTIRAAKAGEEYLAKDSGSKWADEVRQHLGEMEERNAAKTSQASDRIYREFMSGFESRDDDKAWRALTISRNSQGSSIQNKLVDEWLASANGGAGAAALYTIRYAANLESARAGDRYASDLVAFYERAAPKHRADLVLARSLMKSASERFIQSDCVEAINLYSRAGQIFEQIGGRSEAAFTRYRLGHCYVRQAERDKARAIFEPLFAESEAKGYRWLMAQCECQLADIKIGLREYSAAIQRSNHALQLFESYDTYGGVVVLFQLADVHRRLNQVDQSFEYLARALRLATDDLVDQVPQWGSCIVAGLNVNLKGRHRAALEYQTEALQLALAMNRPLLVSRSYEFIAVTGGKLGRYAEGLDQLQRALDIGKGISAEPAGTEIMAHSFLLLGDTYLQAGDPYQALKAYDQSVEFYRKLGFAFYNFDANKGRLRCYVALGDNANAEKEIAAVTVLLEEHRSKITAERYRNSFFDIEQGIVDAVIDFKHSQGQIREAYEYSEQCRARSLFALMKTQNGAPSLSGMYAPLLLPQTQAQMPEQAQLLQYSVLNNKVVAWLVTRSSIQSTVANIESGELKDVIDQYLSVINTASEQQGGRAIELAGRLYEILFRSMEPSLDKAKEIAIVPDKMLNRLPFAALVNPATGKYLLEEYRISYSSSSSAFIVNSTIAKTKGIPAEEQLLAVGGPSLDRSLAEKFRDLPSARKEVKQSARYYKYPQVLIAESAREEKVKSLIEKSDVVVFATHYDINPASSDDSRLLLAAESKQSAKAGAADGLLTAAEVLKLDLKRPRLVVLSACGTGVEQVFAGEGAISMARPFIAKGVPVVVASLWAVDSDATADLMIRFHRYRKVDRLSTASALRQAQLDAIHGTDSRYRLPYYWAAFVTIGGYAEF